jgi:hypothetical protein
MLMLMLIIAYADVDADYCKCCSHDVDGIGK